MTGVGDQGRQPPVQLRIGFSQPDSPTTLAFHLQGLTVVCDVWAGRFDDAWRYLLAAGVTARIEEGRGIVLGLGDLVKLADLPHQVRVEAVGSLETLVKLACRAGTDATPATVQVGEGDELWLGWYDGTTRFEEKLEPEGATALLGSELPFVATPQAWDILERYAGFPLMAGSAAVNLDGYIEITTTKPQTVESAPLPGLFRIDDTHFGIALAYADVISNLPGFQWAGKPPTVERGPRTLARLAVDLSQRSQAELSRIVDQLAGYRAQIVCWDSGLGRRIMALAAVEALDAWPALIVAPPWGVWVWQRHLDLVGRVGSLGSTGAEAQIVTYLDLARGRDLASFGSLIFDDLSGPDARINEARTALRRLDGLKDAYRIGVCSHWPQDPEESCALLDVLRPGEFSLDVYPFEQRYPLRATQRAMEHASVYINQRRADTADAGSTPFRRSMVRTVDASADQLAALKGIVARVGYDDRRRLLAQAMEVLSAGNQTGISPKIGAAVAAAKQGHAQGRTVGIVTASRRAATLLRAALLPLRVARVDEGGGDVAHAVGAADVVVVHWQRAIPNMRGLDDVIILEYPWSTALIDSAVGDADAPDGVDRVVVLHSPGTIDDRIAMFAARRREMGAAVDASGAPDDDEIEYLLTPRWAGPPPERGRGKPNRPILLR